MYNEKGMALIYSLLVSMIVIAALAIGAQLIVTSLKESHKQKAIYAQGEAIARAGISEALSWFRRQQSQPVASGVDMSRAAYPDAAFYPRADTDTIEETTGLVGEISLDTALNLYARYEVKRQSVNNFIDQALTDATAVHDITGQKIVGRFTGQGFVWYIQSTGYVFVKRDNTKKYDEVPNEVLGRAEISTEFRRIELSVPGPAAAVYVETGGPTSPVSKRFHVINTAKVKGGTGANGVDIKSGATEDIGTSNYGYVSSRGTVADITPDTIFKVPASELKLMSDYLVSSVPKLPYSRSGNELPGIGIYYIDCPGNTATFNNNYPLNTSGIIFVNGNLLIQSSDTGSYFTGVIYVYDGAVTIKGPILISGALVCYNRSGQHIYIDGSAGTTEINYDPDIINLVRQQLTQYRENKAMYRVHSVLK